MIIYKINPKDGKGEPVYFDDESVALHYAKQTGGEREDISVMTRGKSWRQRYRELYSFVAGFISIINKFNEIVQPTGASVDYDDKNERKRDQTDYSDR